MPKKPNRFHVLQTKESICFTFSSTMGNIDAVCHGTIKWLGANIKDIDTALFPIHLVIREGLTNAVRHGNANNAEKTIRFLLTLVDNASIKLVIEDEGQGFDWRKQQKKVLLETEDYGRGIAIINSYSSNYFYNEKGNILYLEKII